MKLVIAGAYYYDRNNEVILIPHYTGEYYVVDCYRYMKMEELKERYDENYIKDVLDDTIEFDGELFYNAEYSPQNVNDSWELLSDLSSLNHIEEYFSF